MLVARTKSKQDALPKRQQIVSGARVLARTASAGFSRTEHVRSLEESRRASKSVEQSIAETHKAVGEMRVAQEKADRQQARLRGENEGLMSVESRLAIARKELGAVKDEKKDVQKEFDILVRARDRANHDLARTNARTVDLEVGIARKKAVMEATDKKVAELTKAMNDTAQKKVRSDQEQRALETQVRNLQARSKKYGQKIAAAMQMHQNTMGAIEEARDSFRIFERRIAQFSRETGYIIRYPKVN